MAINVKEEEVISWISELLRSDHSESKGGYVFNAEFASQRLKLSISSSKIQSIISILASKEEENETALYDSRRYECLVRDESRLGMFIRRGDNQITKEDLDNGLTYRISPPTDEYFVFLLSKVQSIRSLGMLRSPLMMHRLIRYMESPPDNGNVLSVLKTVIPRSLTVQVESKRAKNFQELSRHSNAFLFQLAYNLNVPVVESRYLDDLVRSGRILTGRRSRLQDIEAPKRLYITDLIHHYQMGLATDSPSHEYLSYYHVAEHFFEQVYNDDLINSVRDKITQPDFSYRRKKDIQDLIRDVSRRLKTRDESVTFNEQEALRLTLQKYVNFDELVDKVKQYDPTLIDYYKHNLVPFSGGVEVDLESKDATMPDRLARRIYRTRNSIVHSKEGEKVKYVPFEHDKILVREVPLLRFLAEAIIIDTSTVMP